MSRLFFPRLVTVGLSAWIALPLVLASACSGASTTETSKGSPSGGGSGDSTTDAGSASSTTGGGGSNDDGGSGGSGSGNADGSTGGGGGVPSSSGVTILVYPTANHSSQLVAAISGAKTSVYMTMYMIDDKNVIDAIVARKKAGLDVQVILDGSTTTKSNNTSAYNSFKSAGVDVVWSNPTFTYTHEKCVMIDHTEAWIMTANAETSVPDSNREYLAIDDDAADVKEAEAVFVADHAMQAISPTGNLVVANANARNDLVALVNSAASSLDIEDEEFSDNNSKGITDAVVAAAKRGVKVRVIVAGGAPTSSQSTALAAVKSAGGSVYVSDVQSGGGSASDPYIHAKTILVDCGAGTCASGFVGSENLTTGSLEYNREIGVVLTDATQLGAIYQAVSSDFANPKATKM